MYTIPISEVIKKHKLNYHLYTIYTKLYETFKNDDTDSITDQIADCYLTFAYGWSKIAKA